MEGNQNLTVRRATSSVCAVIAVVAWGVTLLVLGRNPAVADAVRTELGDAGVTGATAVITAAVGLLLITLVFRWAGSRVPTGFVAAYLIADVVVWILIGLLSVSVVRFETGAGIMLISGWVFAVPSIAELALAHRSRQAR
ncbi:hypothetical protein SAMN04489732_13013 [Amycolatopsis saalfeldensis]|uniref:Uncharacterized protein n=1 Tax=Amycolatopsis saalfeldensis TaxID=394193 RepID=A0A1H8YNZ0_9PSEU|nr:hypothetical protein SAMN04489732_13013 [Amycolatopsis saalfeldensis]